MGEGMLPGLLASDHRPWQHTSWACPPILNRPIKEADNGGKQREETYSLWPHWEEIKGSIDPKVHLCSPNIRLRFKLKTLDMLCPVKKSWSRPGSAHCWLILVLGPVSPAGSQTCWLSFRETNSSSGSICLLLLTARDSWGNSSFFQSIISIFQ